MVWKVAKKAEGMEPLNGAPAFVDLTDEEFEAANKAYSEVHGFPRNALKDAGYWEHASEKASASSPAKESGGG